jgi:hypothetical protein
MTKIGVRGASRYDQVIVGNFKVWQHYGFSREVETNNFSEQNFHVLTTSQDPADGRSYFSRRDARSRNLIEQRLKGVVVLAIDYRDFNRQFR